MPANGFTKWTTSESLLSCVRKGEMAILSKFGIFSTVMEFQIGVLCVEGGLMNFEY